MCGCARVRSCVGVCGCVGVLAYGRAWGCMDVWCNSVWCCMCGFLCVNAKASSRKLAPSHHLCVFVHVHALIQTSEDTPEDP
jgi:hypothetical protein